MERMRSTKAKLMLVGASLLTILAIFGASFFVGHTSSTHAQEITNPYQVSSDALSNATTNFTTVKPHKAGIPGSAGDCLSGFDSLTNFCAQFTKPGFNPDGTPNDTWTWNMVG